jgi:hypothetical protein
MAQTNFTPISLYYSTTASAAPTAGNLVAGELAINTLDGKLFYKDSAGVVQVIAGKGGAGVAGGSTTQVQYNSSGSLAGSANMTFNGTALTLANDASISGLTVGKGGGSVGTNTVLGSSAFNATNSGSYGTALGYQAGIANTSGSQNTFIGGAAGAANTTGGTNVAVGAFSYYAGTAGSQNAALGVSALENTNGSQNTGIGFQALKANTSGSYNTALGNQSLLSNTTASNNTAVGYQAGYSNTTGNVNCFFGQAAGYSNTTGVQNVVMGDNALTTNSTGSYNTAIGRQALALNTTASNNTAVGYQAGYSNTTGGSFVALGWKAGYTYNNASENYGSTFVGLQAGTASTGHDNQFFGGSAGVSMTTGSANTILGTFSGNGGGLDIRTASNYIVLSDGNGNPRGIFDNNGSFGVGNVPSGSARIYTEGLTDTYNLLVIRDTGTSYSTSNRFAVFYNSSGTIAGSIQHTGVTTTAYATSSDERLKENIVDAPNALEKIINIPVRSYDWKEDKAHVEYGFIAQELEKIYAEPVGVGDDVKENPWNVEYGRLTPILVKAIQELNAKVTALEAQLGK